RKQEIQVSLLETASRILQRVTAPELSEFYTRIHQAQGVSIYHNMTTTRIVGTTQVESISCADGKMIPADLVIVGIGVQPNIELAQAAGIEVDNGIVIDAYGRTND